MIDRIKLGEYLSSLSTDEISSHLKDILRFAKEYQQMANEEFLRRTNNLRVTAAQPEVVSHSASEEENSFSNGEDNVTEMELDYFALNGIQSKVNSLSYDEINKHISQLDAIMGKSASAEEKDIIAFERELCEIRLAESAGEQDRVINKCNACGAELRPNTLFCHKCGNKV